MNEQEILRNAAKAARWQKDITYKQMAAAADLSYKSFLNWLHDSNINLSVKRRYLLKRYLAAANTYSSKL